jgi:hypothetical protein
MPASIPSHRSGRLENRALPGRILRGAAAAAVLGWAGSCARLPARPRLPEAGLPLPDSLLQEPVVILAETTAFEVNAGRFGNVLERKNVAWYRVNRRHPPVLENLEFYENENLQQPAAIRVEAYPPDRPPWIAARSAFRAERVRPQGLQIEASGVVLTAQVPRYEAGMLLRIETVDRYFRPEFLGREGLRGEFPCLRRVVSFRAPAGHGFRMGLRNREGLPIRADTLSADGKTEFRATAADLPKRVPSRSPRDPESWYAALLFSVPYQGLRSWTWSELGDHYLKMIGTATLASGKLREAAVGLGTGAPDADTLADRAFRLVKSRVRYLADSRGMHGWIPREPGSVWNNGYGDCKEMANLLRALLPSGAWTGAWPWYARAAVRSLRRISLP